MKKIGDIIRFSLSSREKVEFYQQQIRDAEWEEIKLRFPKNCSFLDVGCGTGYTLKKAAEDLNSVGIGIDPNPGAHGVGRFSKFVMSDIVKAEAEKIPFESEHFDLVYSSHVLEHVNDEQKSLKEMKRVLKKDGLLIIGMPTALMSWIGLFSNYAFTTHIKIYTVFRYFVSKNTIPTFLSIFAPKSHSFPRAKTIFYDLNHYRINKWKQIISEEFEIIETLQPCLYPYPDFPQFFKLKKSKMGSSSVFFICKKK